TTHQNSQNSEPTKPNSQTYFSFRSTTPGGIGTHKKKMPTQRLFYPTTQEQAAYLSAEYFHRMLELEKSLAAELEALSSLELPPSSFNPLADSDQRSEEQRDMLGKLSGSRMAGVARLRWVEGRGRFAGGWLAWLFPGWFVWLVALFSTCSEFGPFCIAPRVMTDERDVRNYSRDRIREKEHIIKLVRDKYAKKRRDLWDEYFITGTGFLAFFTHSWYFKKGTKSYNYDALFGSLTDVEAVGDLIGLHKED
ncbi:hypothetical protein QBC42DRAFT_318163, partial [Cladorrhinum samala]